MSERIAVLTESIGTLTKARMEAASGPMWGYSKVCSIIRHLEAELDAYFNPMPGPYDRDFVYGDDYQPVRW